MRSSRLTRIKPFTLLRLVGIGLFIYILTRVDLGTIGDLLLHVRMKWFLLGLLFQLLLLLTKTIRWHIMNDGRKGLGPWLRSSGRFLESYAIGVATPGRLGEVIKAGHEEGHANKMRSIIKMISERGYDIGIFLLFAGLALVFGTLMLNDSLVGYALIGGSLILIVIASALLVSGKAEAIIIRWITLIPALRGNEAYTGRKHSPVMVIWIFLLSVAGALSHFISCYWLAISVGLDLPLLTIAGGVAIAGMLNLLPITIMGLGTREAALLTLFSQLDHDTVMAFSFSMLLVAQVGGGLMAMLLGQLLLGRERIKSR